ncbi:MAG: PRD domain-containing protein [Atopobiaceae bacterium]|nr:PRD domain-containing protein [Atopobiaceae bacterium]
MATDELSERMDVLQQAGFVDEAGRRDLEAIADILTTECGVSRDNEILGTLVTHVAAALKRARDGEDINPLDPAIVDDVRSSAVYDEARRIQQEIFAAMRSELSEPEQEFVLVHVGGLLMSQVDE